MTCAKYLPYTGIGARDTPTAVLHSMTAIAMELGRHGFTLRSGGADGADTAFETGVLGESKEIYLPWPRFNENQSSMTEPSAEAYDLSAKFHPAWDNLQQGVKRFHARNAHQVLGGDLKTASLFLIAWTARGLPSGGTGQALRIAKHYEIPIFNLALMTPEQVGGAIEQLM